MSYRNPFLFAAYLLLAFNEAIAQPARVPGFNASSNFFATSTPKVLLSPVLALTSRQSLPIEKITNGIVVDGFPSVGLFVNGNSACTATLIGCRTLLTAAHCVCQDQNTLLTGVQCSQRPDLLDPAGKIVYFHHAGLFSVSSVVVDPDFVFGQTSDLAVIKLASTVTGIAPSPINTSERPAVGSREVIVGFGVTESADSSSGIKRAGNLIIAPCLALGINSTNHICANFLPPLGNPGTNSGTCHGDSGGPLFVESHPGPTIVGTTSGGDSPSNNCTAPNHLWFADVFKDRLWIETTAGSDLGSNSCGGLPAAGGPNTMVSGVTGTLSPSHTSDIFSMAIPAGVTRFRAGLTADSFFIGANDFNLYVKRGGPPTTSSFDCKSDGQGTLAFCEIQSPVAGQWYFLVDRVSGSGGLYELITTLISQPAVSPCVRDATTACLQENRFEVKIAWQNAQGSGTGQLMSFGGQRTENNEAGFFYFQSATNFEMGVKVLNACIPAFGNKYWVFISGLTDQGWTVTVRDTQTGAFKTYNNAIGHLSTTFADTAAFDCN